jgi:hypothetical protein
VLRKYLDQDWAGRVEAVLRRQRLHRILRERNRILAQHGRFVAMHLEHEIAVPYGDELIERVEQRQEIVRDHIERIGAKRAIEGAAGAWLVARAHQVHAEIRRRACIGWIERQRLFCERRRLLESIMACRLLRGRPIDLAVRGIDLKDLRNLRIERRAIVAHVRHRGDQGLRFQIRRIDRERFVQLLACLVGAIFVEVQRRQKKMRFGKLRIDLDRAPGRRRRRWRVIVLQNPSKA